VARGAILRRELAGPLRCPGQQPVLHLPAHWPRHLQWKIPWHNVIGCPTAQLRLA
jgi:hypothetical protein